LARLVAPFGVSAFCYTFTFSIIFDCTPPADKPLKPLLGRVLRNGKKYAEFMDDEPIVLDNFRVCDMMSRRAAGPQGDSDSESEVEDDTDDDSDSGSSQVPPPPRCPPTVAPT
jgi:hypothetical protein